MWSDRQLERDGGCASLLQPVCGIYEPLKEADCFAQAYLDLGTVTWPNGADLDPSWAYDELEHKAIWSVPF
jgi:hypothetical protein